MTYKMGDWYVFCDICGQRWLASETTILSTYTGRGNLIVCPHDADVIDYGLIPYKMPFTKNIPWTRINQTDVTDATPPIDVETTIP